MKKRKLFQLSLFTVLILLCISAFAADASGYHISDYVMIIDVDENNIFHITEEITAVFTASGKHGIIRTIPTVFENRYTPVRDIAVDNKYSVSHEREYVAIRIGDADKTVYGDVKYTILYTLNYGDDFNTDFDKIYHNILGSDWDCDINNFSFVVNLPKDFDEESISITYGPRNSVNKFEEYTVRGRSISGRISNLSAYEAVTLAMQLPEGYFDIPEQEGNIIIPEYGKYNYFILIVSVISALTFLILAMYKWSTKGKDETLFPTAQYYPIEGHSPADVGFIIDGVVNNKDITSLIFYWAHKGYLTIQEEKSNYTFTKIRDPEFFTDYERKVFNKLFEFNIDNRVRAKELQNHFYTVIPDVKAQIKNQFVNEKALVAKESLSLRNKMYALSCVPMLIFIIITAIQFASLPYVFIMAMIFTFYTALIIFLYSRLENSWHLLGPIRKLLAAALVSILVFVGLIVLRAVTAEYFFYENTQAHLLSITILVVLSSISFAFSAAIKKRSEYGDRILGYYLGFKEFIETAQMDRIKLLMDQNPEYFFDILPYAIVLGLEKKWGRKFNNIIQQPPQWYDSSSMRAFSTTMLISRMNGCMNMTTASMISAPSTSSGGGFSSGGFSGGGGGGGGGSSW